MPQMAPISWLTLFITFSITLIIFNTLNYFFYFPNFKTMKFTKKNISSMNWKW